ncbi:MAG TPA: NAD-dependent epimerase/dehydratase family protein, partial [Tepidisphaeraceae bacterium]|nr:NAD-dependent epimerase/dehydratase family protein [Tepidisphaeraceae bacterium]
LKRGATVTQFNRSKRENPFGNSIETIVGDRSDSAAFETAFAKREFDVVIDMICFTPAEAQSDVRAFAGRCEHFIFCSTVCTYGIKIAEQVLIDETFPQEPISDYGKNKVACEKIFLQAAAEKKFAVTIIRPSHTYGPGNPLIDNLEPNALAWDRIERGLPVLCSGDGLGLWQATHRDDVGRLFAYAALNPKTYGQSYNATCRRVLTWRDYYRHAADALGKQASVIFMPSDWIVAHDPKRFGLLREITQFHGAYSSAKAERDVPEYAESFVNLKDGASEVFVALRKLGRWRTDNEDKTYRQMIHEATAAEVKPIQI